MLSETLNASFLKVYIGPMFSSKSSSLLSEINRYKYITDKILVINHNLDKQRHPETMDKGILKTHDNKIFPAIMLSKLEELFTNTFFIQKYLHADIVIIDEGQFYPDLYDFLKTQLNNLACKKLFIVGGLSSDSNMNAFGDMTKIIPLADSVVKLNAYCIYCKDGTYANFTRRDKNIHTQTTKEQPNLNEKDIVLIGSDELYSPCCRYHYLM
jgi:thymidine kinase